MGLIIVTIVGAIIGWLIAIVVERDGRARTIHCTLIGTAGAVAGALLADGVPLFAGVSAMQLLWAVVGSLVAIIALNVAHALRAKAHPSKSLPTRRASGTPAVIRR